MKFFVFLILAWPFFSMAQLPDQPKDAQDPGSSQYAYSCKRQVLKILDREVEAFLPEQKKGETVKAPVIVFGHGQAIDVKGYEQSFVHLAKKGIAILHPTYDKGFFDQDWRRMASDFNQQAASAISELSDYIDPQQVMYAGHSKGGYIALMAAGAPNLKVQLGSVVLFSPAGFDSEYLSKMNPQVPVTLFWPEEDTIIKKASIVEIYQRLPSQHKQWILVRNYPELKADHFFVLNKSYFFGGRNGVSAFHYYGFWKWLAGGAWDLKNHSVSNPYLYGDQSLKTGIEGLEHSVVRNH